MRLFEGKPSSLKSRPVTADEMLARFRVGIEDQTTGTRITIRNRGATQNVIDHRGDRVGLDRTREIPVERAFRVGSNTFFVRI